MTLYLYKNGANVPAMTVENVVSYTDNRITAADGMLYGPLAEGYELSSLPDCSERLRADWRTSHPSQEERMEELEALVAGLLFGNGFEDGGDGV